MNSFKLNKNSVFSVSPCEYKTYEAFGNLVWADGSYNDNREFTGKEKDPTGFHYFPFRYYSADIGRFLSPDPHTLLPGNINLANPQELNPYVYCYNNPVTLIDPNGLYVKTPENSTLRSAMIFAFRNSTTFRFEIIKAANNKNQVIEYRLQTSDKMDDRGRADSQWRSFSKIKIRTVLDINETELKAINNPKATGVITHETHEANEQGVAESEQELKDILKRGHTKEAGDAENAAHNELLDWENEPTISEEMMSDEEIYKEIFNEDKDVY